MVDLPTVCKYKCGTTLVAYDNDAGNFVEEDGTLHSYERCIGIKNEKKTAKSGKISDYKSKGTLANADTPEILEAKKTVILRELDKIKGMVEAF